MSEIITISMTVPKGIVERVDAICEARGETRSAYITRALRNSLAGEEEFVRDMESPVWRAIYKTLADSPSLMGMMAKLIGEEMTEERKRELAEGTKVQAERGRQRSAARRAKRTPKTA